MSYLRQFRRTAATCRSTLLRPQSKSQSRSRKALLRECSFIDKSGVLIAPCTVTMRLKIMSSHSERATGLWRSRAGAGPAAFFPVTPVQSGVVSRSQQVWLLHRTRCTRIHLTYLQTVGVLQPDVDQAFQCIYYAEGCTDAHLQKEAVVCHGFDRVRPSQSGF